MAAEPRVGFRRYPDPTWVKRHGQAKQIYGVSLSLLVWRDKKAEGRCRMCLRDRKVRPLTLHHLVPQSYFRRRRISLIRNVAANMIPLCRICHDLVEVDEAARGELRRLLAPDEVTFALQTAGREWLEAQYPLDRQARQRASQRVREARLQHKRDCHSVFGCVYGCPVGKPA